MKKQWFLLSAVAVMLAGSLVACSNGGESPQPATESSGNVTEPANNAVGNSDTSTDSTVTDDAAADSDAEDDTAADSADSPDTPVSAELEPVDEAQENSGN